MARIERKGISFREFLARAMRKAFCLDSMSLCRMKSALPIPTMSWKPCAFDDEAQQRARHQETLASIPEEELTPEMQDFHSSRLHFIELYEEEHFNDLLGKLNTFHFDLQQYLMAGGTILEIIEEDHKRTPFHTLKETYRLYSQQWPQRDRDPAL